MGLNSSHVIQLHRQVFLFAKMYCADVPTDIRWFLMRFSGDHTTFETALYDQFRCVADSPAKAITGVQSMIPDDHDRE